MLPTYLAWLVAARLLRLIRVKSPASAAGKYMQVGKPTSHAQTHPSSWLTELNAPRPGVDLGVTDPGSTRWHKASRPWATPTQLSAVHPALRYDVAVRMELRLTIRMW